MAPEAAARGPRWNSCLAVLNFAKTEEAADRLIDSDEHHGNRPFRA